MLVLLMFSWCVSLLTVVKMSVCFCHGVNYSETFEAMDFYIKNIYQREREQPLFCHHCLFTSWRWFGHFNLHELVI